MGDVIIDGLTGANRLVILDANGKIPALDGSLVTAIAGANFSTGTIPVARIDTGTAAGKVVKLDGNAKLPAVSGAALTGVVGATKNASDPTLTTNPSGGVGTEWHNTTSGEVYICTDATTNENTWKNVGEHSGDIQPLPGQRGSRGFAIGGHGKDSIDYWAIATLGNASDFGNQITAYDGASGSVTNVTRGIYSGGGATNIIEYIADIMTLSNGAAFGNLGVGCSGNMNGNHTRAVAGVMNRSDNRMEYFTIASTGNATDFGDLPYNAIYGYAFSG